MKPTRLFRLVVVVAAACAIVPLAAQSAAQPQWSSAQKRDPADTYTFTRFTLTGRFVHAAQQPAERPAITVDCIPPEASQHGRYQVAALLAGQPLQVKYVEPEEIRGTSYYPKVAVRYRTDAGEERQDNWALGTDRTPAPNPADKSAATIPRATLKQFLHAHTVVITASDAHGAPLEVQFEMPSALPVEAGCNMSE